MQDDSESLDNIEKLIEIMLNDTDPERSRNAAFDLSQMNYKSLINPFITVIYGNCESVRPFDSRVYHIELQKLAIQGLGKIGDSRGVEALIFALEKGGPSDSNNLTFHAAKSLADIGDERAIDPLISILERVDSRRRARDENGVGSDWNAVTACLSALGDFDNDIAIDELTKRLDDPEQRVRHWAAMALRRKHNSGRKEVKSQLLRKIREGGGMHYGITLSLIGGEEEADQLVKMIGNDGVSNYAVFTALVEIAPMLSVEPLTYLLSDDDFSNTAASLLGRIGDDRALPSLLHLLREGRFGRYETDNPRSVGSPWRPIYGQKKVYYNVIRALGEIGDPISVKPLLKLLDQEHPTSVKHDVIWSLGMIGDKSACARIFEFTNDWILHPENPDEYGGAPLAEIASMALEQINSANDIPWGASDYFSDQRDSL